jgi:hypothetical protein
MIEHLLADPGFIEARAIGHSYHFGVLEISPPSWEAILSNLGVSSTRNQEVRYLSNMGFVSLRADRIPQVKQARSELQTLSDVYECTAHSYISMSDLSGGYGRHNDDSEVWSWQCHGYSHWYIEDPKGHYEVVLEPGSWLYIPSMMWHTVTPLGARAGISFALEEGKPMRVADGRRVGVWGTAV